MGERKRETVRERERERGGGVKKREKDEESMRKGKVPEKQMCRNCTPIMNVNTLWKVRLNFLKVNNFFTLRLKIFVSQIMRLFFSFLKKYFYKNYFYNKFST